MKLTTNELNLYAYRLLVISDLTLADKEDATEWETGKDSVITKVGETKNLLLVNEELEDVTVNNFDVTDMGLGMSVLTVTITVDNKGSYEVEYLVKGKITTDKRVHYKLLVIEEE